MVVANFLLDDKSPLLRYDSNFLLLQGNDNLSAWYYLGTYTVTATEGATMQWTFNGSGFTIWGVLSYNHGDFSVQVDNELPTTTSGTVPTPLFQQSLVNRTLDQGTHSVTLTNLGTGTTVNALDVDMVTFQSDIEGTEQLVPNVIQDTDGRFQWSSGWDATPTNVSLFNNGSGHATTSASASVTLSFTGVAVSLYGSIGPNNGQYQVQLDGITDPQPFNGASWDTYTQVMLYHANDIGDGPHELTVYNAPAGSQNTLAIDYAEILSSTNDACSTGSSSSNSQTSQKDLIGGLVVTSVLALLAILSALYLLRSNRKLKQFNNLSALATQSPDHRRGPFFRTDSVRSSQGPYIPASAAVAPSTVPTSRVDPSSASHDTPATSSQALETSQWSTSDSRRRALPRPSTMASTATSGAEAPPAYQ